MPAALSGSLRLYALVPAAEAPALKSRRGFSLVTCGPAAALCGSPPDPADPTHAALWHDRIVGAALARCSSVIPFRLGTDFSSKAELRSALSSKAGHFAGELERFHGRVEMGLKMRLASTAAAGALRDLRGLARIRSLAPEPADRCESFSLGLDGRVFAGCYLVTREAVEGFWEGVQEIRRDAPEIPVLGSGPWAPYSFCAPSL